MIFLDAGIVECKISPAVKSHFISGVPELDSPLPFCIADRISGGMSEEEEEEEVERGRKRLVTC